MNLLYNFCPPSLAASLKAERGLYAFQKESINLVDTLRYLKTQHGWIGSYE